MSEPTESAQKDNVVVVNGVRATPTMTEDQAKAEAARRKAPLTEDDKTKVKVMRNICG